MTKCVNVIVITHSNKIGKGVSVRLQFLFVNRVAKSLLDEFSAECVAFSASLAIYISTRSERIANQNEVRKDHRISTKNTFYGTC